MATYGRSVGSSRVRGYEWLERFAIDFDEQIFAATSPLPKAQLPIAQARHLVQSARRTKNRVLLLRRATPFGHGRSERRAALRSESMIYDLDDAVFEVPDGRFSSHRRQAETAAQLASHVIAGNSLIADWASSFNRNVTLIPSCVEPNNYETKTDFELSDPPRAVWVGSHSTEKFLSLIAAPLLELHRRHGLRLTVIGASDQVGNDALAPMVDRVPWSEEITRKALAQADVGIMPVPDTPFARGKCGYKTLQYGSARLPVVVSDVGPANRQIVGSDAGVLTDDLDQAWLDSLDMLLSAGAGARMEMASALHERVRTQYSYDAWAATWKMTVT